jgi:DNA-binding NtrC family response regulator
MPNVLLIDSDPIVRNYQNDLLVQRGIVPHQALNAAEARRLLALNEYDLVIIDASTGDDQGSLVDFIHRSHPEIAAHMIVTVQVHDFARPFSDVGCAFLSKPFPASEFHRIVELCLDGEEVAAERQH